MTDNEEDTLMRRRLSPTFTIEDTGDGFMLILTGEGHDATISVDDSLARDAADFILERQRFRAGRP